MQKTDRALGMRSVFMGIPDGIFYYFVGKLLTILGLELTATGLVVCAA